MRFLLRSLTCCLIAAPAFALGWGIEGHKAIGQLARTKLSPAARAQVIKILGNDDLAEVAVWADEVRDAGRHRGPLVSDPEARAFIQKFPKNPSWHFVDQPLGLAGYTTDGKFSSEDDVVHAINASIAVLEGRSNRFTPAQALRLLIHFVGDVHQPLHASTGYYDLHNLASPKLVTNPAAVDLATGDHGGNSLYVTKSEELHALWDVKLVEKIAGKDFEKLAGALGNKNPAKWHTPGDYHTWAAQWASESVAIAAGHVYRDVIFEAAELDEKHQLKRMEIKLGSSYEKNNETVVAAQLATAGLRLAELLNQLHWK